MKAGKRTRMKRTAAALTALAMILTMGFALTGCGESYDPTALVKANLDYMTTGEITDEILSETDQSEEELKKAYEDDLNSTVDMFLQEMQMEADFEITDEIRTAVQSFIQDALKKAKYEVKPEFTEEEGVYYVDVDVYPMDFLATTEEWLAGETYLEEWEEKITSGEYVYTTDEQLLEDVYFYMFEKISGFVEETGYLDPVAMTVKVQETDGVYSPDEADMEAIGAALLGE